MLRKAMPGLILFASVMMTGLAFAAESPTLQQVYQAAQAGRMDEAQGMIQKVLQEHPNSAKAHFVDAELLAKQGQSSNAAQELNAAERLEPGLPFVKPQAVQDLKSRILIEHQHQSPINSYQTANAGGFPWGLFLLGIGLIAVITMIVRAMTARNAAPAAGYANNYQQNIPAPVGGQPYSGGWSAPVAPVAPATGGMGSGIMSSLATGAALGAGMVAGEAIAHHFMDGNHSGDANAAPPAADAWNSSSDNMGGTDFGIADASSWDDNSNMADISGGGDDWT